jgi:hypothetical protein
MAALDAPPDAASNALARTVLPAGAVREAANCSNSARCRASSTTTNGLASATAHPEQRISMMIR